MAHSIETKTTFAAVNRLFARSTAFDAGAEIEGTDEPFYYLQDMLHSVVALTDDLGVVVEEYEYEPYGQTYIIDPVTSLRIPQSVNVDRPALRRRGGFVSLPLPHLLARPGPLVAT